MKLSKIRIPLVAAVAVAGFVTAACGSPAAPSAHAPPSAPASKSAAAPPLSAFTQPLAGGIVAVQSPQPGTVSTDLITPAGQLRVERGFTANSSSVTLQFPFAGESQGEFDLNGAQVRPSFNAGITEIAADGPGSSAGEVNLNGVYTALVTPPKDTSYGAAPVTETAVGWNGSKFVASSTESGVYLADGQLVDDEATPGTVFLPGGTEVDSDPGNDAFQIGPAGTVNTSTADTPTSSPFVAGQLMVAASPDSFLTATSPDTAATQLYLCTIKSGVVDVSPGLLPSGSDLVVTDAVVSPDGKTVAFVVTNADGNSDLYTTPINASGAQPKLVEHLDGGIWMLAAWLK
jgi:hypothetical protein